MVCLDVILLWRVVAHHGFFCRQRLQSRCSEQECLRHSQSLRRPNDCAVYTQSRSRPLKIEPASISKKLPCYGRQSAVLLRVFGAYFILFSRQISVVGLPIVAMFDDDRGLRNRSTIRGPSHKHYNFWGQPLLKFLKPKNRDLDSAIFRL